MRPGGGRKNSQKAGGYGRNRPGSSGGGAASGGMHHYRQNGKLTLDDLSMCVRYLNLISVGVYSPPLKC